MSIFGTTSYGDCGNTLAGPNTCTVATSLGDLIAVWCGNGQGVNILVSTVTDSAGNSYTRDASSFVNDGSNENAEFWYCLSATHASATNTITVSWVGGITGILAAWSTPVSGGTAVLDTQAVGGATSGTTNVTGTFNTTGTDELVFAGLFDQNYQAGTAISPYTVDGYVYFFIGTLEHHKFSSTQTGITAGFTTGTGAPWVVSAIAFKAAPLTHSISGNAGVAGATVAWTGTASGSTTADGSGNYTIPSLADGSYTVTASKTGYTFTGPTPANPQVVSGADLTGVNFVATQILVSTPTLSPNGGTFASGPVVVTVTDTDSALTGFAMYYTTDGTTPTTGSTPYTVPISLSVTTTLKVLAVATGYANSAIASATYTIRVGGHHNRSK